MCNGLESALATIETEQQGGLWHKRMRHFGRGGIKQLMKEPAKFVRSFKTTKEECDICVRGKQSRQPFKYSGKRARVSLELIHFDICGPMFLELLGGAKFFTSSFFLLLLSMITAVKNLCIFLKHKSEAIKAFRNFKTYAKNKLEKK